MNEEDDEMTRPVCAIVGAGEGLGRALAARFATEGCDLALVSRTHDGSQAAIDAASENGATVTFRAGDAMKPESIEGALNDAAAEMGPIDVLIYNVRDSFPRCAPLDIDYGALEVILHLEVIGALAAAKAVMPGMCRRGHGTVIFSGATAALRGSATHPLYAIGKFGLRALSQSLAKAHAPDGVHVVNIRLDCDLDTSLMRELYGDNDTSGLANPDAVAGGYWAAHCQPKGAWSNEIELRPFTESWSI
tara:strand:+ start:3893 stop:4636 length:744 start_codon:yes stop_codon:yes gene_type:complete